MPYKYPQALRGNINPLILQDFSGGWNCRDAPSEIANTEFSEGMNVSLDERGGIVKRLGLLNMGAGLSAPALNMFYWSGGNFTLVQDGATLKKTSNFITYTNVKTFSTAARVSMVDFQGKLLIVHPVDKVWIYDGTAAPTTPVGGSPPGFTLAAWQNKAWVAGDPAFPARVYACKPGDPLTWDMTATGDYIDIREKDGLPITLIGAGQGMDISGRPGLLVFKADSTHRINDSRSGTTFGSYTTLHNRAGCVGPLAARSTQNGQVVFLSHRGLFLSDGVNTPVLVSGKISPFFTDRELNFAQSFNWSSGTYNDRVVFSVTRGAGQTTNNFSLEFSPSQGWIVPHNFGCSCFTEDLSSSQRRMRGASPTSPKVFEVFATGADDGAPITARFQSRWFEPANDYMIRMRRLMVKGRGDFNLYTKGDYNLGLGQLSHFVSGGAGGIWGTSIWGAAVWGATYYETYQPFYSLGVARSVAFRLEETSSTSVFQPSLNGDGSAAEAGAFALYGLKLDYIRLGYT